MLGTVAAVAVGLSACGGDSSSNKTSGEPSVTGAERFAEGAPPLPKDVFLAHANASCARQHAEMLENLASYRRKKPTSWSEHKFFARATGDVILPSLLFWHDGVNILTPPEGEGRRVKTMLRVWEHELEVGLDHPYGFRSPHQLAGLFAPFASMARRYGLGHCIVTSKSFQPDSPNL